MENKPDFDKPGWVFVSFIFIVVVLLILGAIIFSE